MTWQLFIPLVSTVAGVGLGFWLGFKKSRHDRREIARDAFLVAVEPVLFAARLLDEHKQDHRSVWRYNRKPILKTYFAFRRYVPEPSHDEFNGAYRRYHVMLEETMDLTIDRKAVDERMPPGRVKGREEFIECLTAMIRIAKQ